MDAEFFFIHVHIYNVRNYLVNLLFTSRGIATIAMRITTIRKFKNTYSHPRYNSYTQIQRKPPKNSNSIHRLIICTDE